MRKRENKLLTLVVLMLGSLLFMGQSCNQPPDNPTGYVGAEKCQQCHPDVYDEFIESGHPYKFNVTDKDSPAAPTYPSFVENYMELPTGASSWSDISGVIGGFGWKARYVDMTGVIVGTASSIINPGGGQNQLNFFPDYDGKGTFSDYESDTEDKEYNYACFKCHTTGAEDTEEKNWLTEKLGVESDRNLGYFEFGGVQCEECHGKGGDHASSMSDDDISLPEGEEINDLCGRCHTRDAANRVLASGDFVKHHEQYDEFIHSAHYLTAGLNCTTCHDQHKRVVWNGDGIIKECTDCHASVTVSDPHDSIDCITCHLPFAAKSSQQTGYMKADVRSHTFSISTDPNWEMLIEDTDGKLVMQTDDNGKNHLNLKYVCYQCHNTEEGEGGGGSTKTLDELGLYAISIHSDTTN